MGGGGCGGRDMHKGGGPGGGPTGGRPAAASLTSQERGQGDRRRACGGPKMGSNAKCLFSLYSIKNDDIPFKKK